MTTVALHPSTQEAHMIATYCRKMYDKGYAPAHAGNVSVKTDDGVYITPSGWCLGDVQAQHIVLINASGEVKHAPHGLKPSSERLIHASIYRSSQEINAVVHAHPPKAVGLCLAGVSLEKPLLAEVLLTLGPVPLLPYTLPGSQALAEVVYQAFKTHHAVLLANHGVITAGRTLEEAYYRLELVEALAESTICAYQLGGVNELTPAQVDELFRVHGS